MAPMWSSQMNVPCSPTMVIWAARVPLALATEVATSAV